MAKDFAITIPAGTTEASPYTEELTLSKGMLQKVTIHFPAGCQYLVHCKIFRWSHQLYPEDDDRDLAYEDYTWESNVPYPLVAEPYVLRFVAWSPLCDYAHTIRVGIDIMSEDLYSPVQQLLDAIKRFLKLVGVWR